MIEKYLSGAPLAQNTILEASPDVAQTIEVSERKRFTYSELTKQIRELRDALKEAKEEGYIFRERPARNKGEQALGELELAKDSFEGEAEKYAQNGNPEKERGMRMWAQLKEAQIQIVAIYLDVLRDSKEFADLIAEDNPWIVELLDMYAKEALPKEEIEFEIVESPKAKLGIADDYHSEKTGLQQAA
jgi:hypothetical protein